MCEIDHVVFSLGSFQSDNNDDDEEEEDEFLEEVDELDFRDEGQYWLTDSNLVVQGSVAFSTEEHGRFLQQQKRHRDNVTKVAVDKLKG